MAKKKTDIPMLVAVLATTFNREVDEPLLMGYTMGLNDLAIADVQRSVERAIRECKFMPTPAELRALCGELKPEARAVIAWTVTDKAVRQHGAYRSVQFDDPVTQATINRMGGWVAFCEIPLDELPFKRKEFEAVYTALYQTGVHESDTSAQLGVIDQENSREGYDRAGTLRIECGLPKPRRGIVRPSIGSTPHETLPQLEHVGRLPE